jgi:hypothetical protein
MVKQIKQPIRKIVRQPQPIPRSNDFWEPFNRAGQVLEELGRLSGDLV